MWKNVKYLKSDVEKPSDVTLKHFHIFLFQTVFLLQSYDVSHSIELF